jgi:hypothetical protein
LCLLGLTRQRFEEVCLFAAVPRCAELRAWLYGENLLIERPGRRNVCKKT